MKGIQLKEVTKRYSDVLALDNINLTIEPNKIYGLLGRNGAGKTTMLNAITGRIFIDEGQINLDGDKILENDKALNQIYMMSEQKLFPESMKLSEAMLWTGRFYKNFDISNAKELSKAFGLSENKRFKTLSTGYKTIYKLILALSANVQYLILDEPVLGLDANHRDLLYKALLNQYVSSQSSIVISTHLVEEVSNLIEDVIIIRDGRIIYNNTREELLSSGYVISGSSNIVDEFVKDKNVLGTDAVGNLKSAYVQGEQPSHIPQGLDVSKMDLQKLFIQMTN